MNIHLLRTSLLAGATSLVLLTGAQSASAAAYVDVRVGAPPPPVIVEHRWARPYRGAVWIAGHHEWRDGRWVWIGGYYAYPPRRGAVWVAPRYRGGYYRDGYWR